VRRETSTDKSRRPQGNRREYLGIFGGRFLVCATMQARNDTVCCAVGYEQTGNRSKRGSRVRVLSYNILTGGTTRVDQLERMIRGSQADVVGLAEATNAQVVEELAKRLNMHFFLTGQGRHSRDWQVALLSRLPIISTRIYTNAEIFARKHVLEATLEEADGQQVSIFVAHFTASFYRGPESNRRRRAEVQEIMRSMEEKKGQAHLLMGDFNSIAPGDRLDASEILRYSLRLRDKNAMYRRQKKQREPGLTERFIVRLIRLLLWSRGGRRLIDASTPLYTQGGIDLLLQEGYSDCFRTVHPQESGYTFPAANPSCRIDYIFASPELAQRLQGCEVVVGGEGVKGEAASDHLPVCAEFGER
jgi:endonuclease/exonuclease/phosphatase family metal-dependent hydrolase